MSRSIQGRLSLGLGANKGEDSLSLSSTMYAAKKLNSTIIYYIIIIIITIVIIIIIIIIIIIRWCLDGVFSKPFYFT